MPVAGECALAEIEVELLTTGPLMIERPGPPVGNARASIRNRVEHGLHGGYHDGQILQTARYHRIDRDLFDGGDTAGRNDTERFLRVAADIEHRLTLLGGGTGKPSVHPFCTRVR
jgi:hypothetical protein